MADILFKRGNETDLPAAKDGQILFATDTGNMFIDKGNKHIQINANQANRLRGCVASLGATTSGSYYWLKVAEISSRTSEVDDLEIAFKVSTNFTSTSTRSGILRLFTRFKADHSVEKANLYWEYANNIDTDKFAITYNPTDSKPVVILWACLTRYEAYHFDVLEEGTRTTRSKIWTLYNSTSTNAVETLPEGHTCEYSVLLSLKNTAATATKVSDSLTVKLNGGATEGTNMFTFDGSAAKTVNITPDKIGAAKASDQNIKLYTSFSQLSDELIPGSETIELIATKMQNNSILQVTIDSNYNSDIYPEQYGTLIVRRASNASRCYFEFHAHKYNHHYYLTTYQNTIQENWTRVVDTNSAQTIDGAKTFTAVTAFKNQIKVHDRTNDEQFMWTSTDNNYGGFVLGSNGGRHGRIQMWGGTNYINLVSPEDGYTKTRTVRFPDNDGIIALTTDIKDNTWRKVQVNGADILGTATTTAALNLKAGTNVSIANSGGTVTFSAADTKVTQAAAITTNKEYPIILGYSDETSALTNTVNKTTTLKYNPSTKILTTPVLRITSTGDAEVGKTMSNTVGLAIGPSDSVHLELDTNELIAKNGSSASTLHINADSVDDKGNLISGGPIEFGSGGIVSKGSVQANGFRGKFDRDTSNSKLALSYYAADNSTLLQYITMWNTDGIILNPKYSREGIASYDTWNKNYGLYLGEKTFKFNNKLHFSTSTATVNTSNGNKRNLQGDINALYIYGSTYGNAQSDPSNSYIAVPGKLSYGDPGPQIIFNASPSGDQAAALIFTDHDTIAEGTSLSLVSNQSNVAFIAPTIKTQKLVIADADNVGTIWTSITKGTTSTVGKAQLVLGNSTASGTTNNARGELFIYSSGGKGSYIQSRNTDYTSYFYLPAGASNNDSCYAIWSPNQSTAVGSTTRPVYIKADGQAAAINALTANRALISNASGDVAVANHFANSSKVAINSTDEPSYNFYVNGSMGGTKDLILGVTSAAEARSVTVRHQNASLTLHLAAANNRGLYDSTTNFGNWILYANGDDKASRHTYITDWKSKGDSTTPVYFNSSGEPVACTSTIATSANKLYATKTIASSTQYFPMFVAGNSTGNKDAYIHPRYYYWDTGTRAHLCIGEQGTSNTNATGAYAGGITINSGSGKGKYVDIIPAAMTKYNEITIPDNTGTLALLTQNDTNALLNLLSEGSSNAQGADFLIAQYAGGGTSTTTYHRRPVSKVVNASVVKAALGTGTGTTKYLREDGTWVQPPNTDTKVAQTPASENTFRPIVLGAQKGAAGAAALEAETTSGVHTSAKFYANASTGSLYATTFVAQKFSSADGQTLMTLSNSNEISFNGANNSRFYFGYANRLNATTPPSEYWFGTHSGSENAGKGKIVCGEINTGNIYTKVTGQGYFLVDSGGTSYPGVYDNGSNLWLGSIATASTHHKGSTFISAGHNGTTGNATIYVCVPNDANNNGNSYGVFHTGYLDVSKATTGTLSIARGGTGATTAAAARTNLEVPPTDHSSTATTYGIGTAAKYGHVILYPAASCQTYTSDDGALTPAAVKKLHSLYYATCDTAAATAVKTVDCSAFSLETGAKITVKFTITNMAANPALNVNSTGAKPIYYRGAAIPKGYLAAGRTYTFVYNGTQYELIGDIDANTVTQAVRSTNGEFPILLRGTSAGTTTTTTTTTFTTRATLNPSTGAISTTGSIRSNAHFITTNYGSDAPSDTTSGATVAGALYFQTI